MAGGQRPLPWPAIGGPSRCSRPARATSRSGLTLSMSDYQAVPPDDAGAVARLERMRGHAEDVFLEACRGDDFVGVQSYTPHPGRGRLQPRRPRTAGSLVMGYEFYPRSWPPPSVGPGSRPATCPSWSPRTASAPTTTSSASPTWPAPSTGCSTASTTASTCAATRTGALLDNFEWAFGYAPRFGLVERRPGYPAPQVEAERPLAGPHRPEPTHVPLIVAANATSCDLPPRRLASSSSHRGGWPSGW